MDILKKSLDEILTQLTALEKASTDTSQPNTMPGVTKLARVPNISSMDVALNATSGAYKKELSFEPTGIREGERSPDSGQSKRSIKLLESNSRRSQ